MKAVNAKVLTTGPIVANFFFTKNQLGDCSHLSEMPIVRVFLSYNTARAIHGIGDSKTSHWNQVNDTLTVAV